GDTEQGVTNLDEVLGDDPVLTGGQPVQDRQDASGGRVLDRHHEAVHFLAGQRLERGHKTRETDPFVLGEQLPTRPVGVREGFALVTDDHRSKRYRPGRRTGHVRPLSAAGPTRRRRTAVRWWTDPGPRMRAPPRASLRPSRKRSSASWAGRDLAWLRSDCLRRWRLGRSPRCRTDGIRAGPGRHRVSSRRNRGCRCSVPCPLLDSSQTRLTRWSAYLRHGKRQPWRQSWVEGPSRLGAG